MTTRRRLLRPCFLLPPQVSSPYCAEIVESADAYLFAGPIFNDYSSVGYSLLIKDEKSVRVEAERVRFSCFFSLVSSTSASDWSRERVSGCLDNFL